MKKITFLLTLTFIMVLRSYGQFPAPYCGPLEFASNVEPISLVNFAGINNVSDATADPTVNAAHEDFTSLTANVVAGSTYPISIQGNTDGSYTDKVRLFIDWNQNNDFTDAGESYDLGNIVGSTGTDNFVLLSSITVPVSALAGTTRMRVVKRWLSYSDSCNTGGTGYGQAEDYSISVTIPNCLGLDGLTVTGITTTTATISWNAATTSVGYEYVLDNSASDPSGNGTVVPDPTYLATPLTAGTTYYFHVRNDCTSVSNSTWSTISFTTLPANDECATAIDINCGDTITNQTTAGATGGTATSCIGTIGNDIWYRFVGDGLQNVLTATASVENPQLEVYASTDGTCSGFTAGSCFAADGTGNAVASVTFNSTLGTVYYIHVGNWINGNPGVVFDLSLTCATPPSPPVNDDCLGALPLTVAADFTSGVVSGTILAANTDTTVTPSCQALFGADVWYTVVVPASGSVTIETQTNASNSMSDSVIAAFSGSCGSLTEIGCNDDKATSDFMSLLSLTALNPGDVIYVGVWKYQAAAPVASNSQFQIAAYDASLTTNSFDNSKFVFYPNPVKDVLNISYSKNISKVQVINLLGQEVVANTLNAAQTQVDLSKLTTGTYLVKVTSDNEVKTIKVIKE
ncbi:T9SS type A sorting domain-containing protein [Flavobacterium sp. SUN046]|uniref:GEVED domain-containing protein n=1 Tax=Flavobacterium sp. SUN046 TaxID=3002440 RepID=UPI002DBA4C5A|nr:T9SS type A sorting domain-containing protein [Flavobacterium sp. SUN046]MEC4048400.1 T9SS type A sorting domain-containing protein [Flavobacterium sp. SUN046]